MHCARGELRGSADFAEAMPDSNQHGSTGQARQMNVARHPRWKRIGDAALIVLRDNEKGTCKGKERS